MANIGCFYFSHRRTITTNKLTNVHPSIPSGYVCKINWISIRKLLNLKNSNNAFPSKKSNKPLRLSLSCNAFLWIQCLSSQSCSRFIFKRIWFTVHWTVSLEQSEFFGYVQANFNLHKQSVRMRVCICEAQWAFRQSFSLYI